MGVPANTRVLVYLNGSDPRLEGLYLMGAEVGDTLGRIGVSLVGAPSFSMFLVRPRSDQIYNLRRMFTVLGELEERDLPVFPTVFATGEADIACWVRWLAERPRVWLVGTVIQRQEARYFDDQIMQLVWMQRALRDRELPLHVILYGVGAPKRVQRARELGLRCFVCITSEAAMTAGMGRRLIRANDRLIARRDPEGTREALLAANLRVQTEAFAEFPLDPGGLVQPATIDYA